MAALEAKAAGLKSRLRDLAPSSDQKTKLDKELTDVQEQLLDLVFERECTRTDMTVQVLRGPGEPPPAWVEITTFFATNRAATGNASPENFFGYERRSDTQEGKPDLQYGKTVVSIPTARHPGDDFKLPSLWKFELSPDPSKHFILKSVIPLPAGAAQSELAKTIRESSKKSLLIFVHGYNVSFADASLRTAQLAHDLSFPGTAIFFSWPSAGQTRKYPRDEEAVQLSEKAFDAFLDDIGALGASEIFLIAHSMGNRLVTEILRDRVSKGKATANLRELLLAAPDINAEVFKETIMPALSGITGLHRTIYASSSDVALRASSIIHDYRRVGDTQGGMQTFAGFETVDASKVAPLVRAFGHSYIVDSVKVLGDMSEMFSLHFNADQRSLIRAGSPPSVWWVLE